MIIGPLGNTVDGCCPVNGVGNDALNVGVMEGGAGLVAGLEVEDFPQSASEGHAAAENFTAGKPTDKYGFVRLGNVKYRRRKNNESGPLFRARSFKRSL